MFVAVKAFFAVLFDLPVRDIPALTLWDGPRRSTSSDQGNI